MLLHLLLTWFILLIQYNNKSITVFSQLLNPDDPLTLKEVTSIPGIRPFYVGSVHYDWCLKSEADQVSLMTEILTKKQNNCLVVDVGMNDGFYTAMAGAFGCQVYSFELQRRCIELAELAINKNGFTELVNIFHRPVSRKNNELISIPFPSSDYCDGGFTFSGFDQIERSHSQVHRFVNRTFSTISLNSILPKSTFIDVLKIDVEGHETEVLSGAMNIFREYRVGTAVVELSGPVAYNNVTELLELYRQIVSFGYSLTTLNCRPGRGDPEIFNNETFQGFIDYFYISIWSRWRCMDIKIHLMG